MIPLGNINKISLQAKSLAHLYGTQFETYSGIYSIIFVTVIVTVTVTVNMLIKTDRQT